MQDSNRKLPMCPHEEASAHQGWELNHLVLSTLYQNYCGTVRLPALCAARLPTLAVKIAIQRWTVVVMQVQSRKAGAAEHSRRAEPVQAAAQWSRDLRWWLPLIQEAEDSC